MTDYTARSVEDLTRDECDRLGDLAEKVAALEWAWDRYRKRDDLSELSDLTGEMNRLIAEVGVDRDAAWRVFVVGG